MTAFKLNTIEMLFLLWALPFLLGLFIYAARKRKTAMLNFISAGLYAKNPPPISPMRRGWKAALVLAAFGCIVFALARPAWNPSEATVKRSGRDVVFMLDVSRSMLAEDLVPNRLERAKLAILDAVGRLQGDRVALVAFAGTATIKCPLTLDYGFFRMMLDDISTESTSRGGTLLGDAIRTVLDQVFDDQVKKYKDIILITDGEDHESFPVEAARMAGEKGIRLIIIGLGDEKEGQRIPLTDAQGQKTFLKYQGREVWTKLDADTLRQMADATPGGRYLPVATGTIDLGDVYAQLIALAEKKELAAKTFKRYEEKFQLFIGLALMLLIIEALISDKRQNGMHSGGS
ncbi:MAG: VWA domain-containing protein [Proteobacteria bacterium]|nr:VWA domain-containing protein [Pseudomonadota bacterium]MBU1710281.1 VWA domain-containing protein [Pseudomonadota bacterium]